MAHFITKKPQAHFIPHEICITSKQHKQTRVHVQGKSLEATLADATEQCGALQQNVTKLEADKQQLTQQLEQAQSAISQLQSTLAEQQVKH